MAPTPPQLQLTLLLPWLLLPGLAAAGVTAVQVHPSFETAGVLLTLDQDPASCSVQLELDAGDGFRPTTPPVRYDSRHMAASIFGLEPGQSYTLRVSEGGAQQSYPFVTRVESDPLKASSAVRVSNTSELRAALAAAAPGQEIILAPGSYAGGLSLAASGSSESPIVIRGDVPADQLQRPIQQRQGLPVIGDAGEGYGLEISGSYVVVDSLRLEGNRSGGVRLDGGAHCVIQRCQIYDNGSWANVLITHGGAAAGYHLIQDNHIADLTHDSAYAPSTGGDDSVTYYGVRNDDSPGPGTIIRRNLIEQHYDGITPCNDEEDSAAVSEDDPDVLARWPNHDVEVYDNTIVDQRDDGIEADGICVNARIYRNRISRCTNATSISPALPGPYYFVRNVLSDFQESSVKFNTAKGRGTIRNIFYYHNTISRGAPSEESENAALYLYDGTPSKDVFFRNNIFVSPQKLMIIQPDGSHDPDMDYDLWYAEPGPDSEAFVWWGHFKESWSGWQTATGKEPHGVWGNPQLDSQLACPSGSPAIDRGVRLPGINDRYSGEGPDIGASELGGTEELPPLPQLPPGGDGGQPDGGGAPSQNPDNGNLSGGCALQRADCRMLSLPLGILLLLLIGLFATHRR